MNTIQLTDTQLIQVYSLVSRKEAELLNAMDGKEHKNHVELWEQYKALKAILHPATNGVDTQKINV